MDRRKLLGFLGFTTAATVVGAEKLGARPSTPEPVAPPEVPRRSVVVDLPIGMIVAMAPGYQAMPQWLVCDGRRLRASEYPALYAVIGKLYGGDPSDGDIFMLPDMRPRLAMHDYGSHSHRFIADEVPAHSHSVGPTHQHTMWEAWNREVPSPMAGPVYVTGRSLGNGEYEAVPAHNHVQPTLAIQHLIKAL